MFGNRVNCRDAGWSIAEIWSCDRAGEMFKTLYYDFILSVHVYIYMYSVE